MKSTQWHPRLMVSVICKRKSQHTVERSSWCEGLATKCCSASGRPPRWHSITQCACISLLCEIRPCGRPRLPLNPLEKRQSYIFSVGGSMHCVERMYALKHLTRSAFLPLFCLLLFLFSSTFTRWSPQYTKRKRLEPRDVAPITGYLVVHTSTLTHGEARETQLLFVSTPTFPINP